MYTIHRAGLGSFIVAPCFGNFEHELFSLCLGPLKMRFVSRHLPEIRANCSTGTAAYANRTIMDYFDCHNITEGNSQDGFLLVIG
jgi:hypothetical protein